MSKNILIEIKGLKKTFKKKSGFFINKKIIDIHAVNYVNLSIKKGETIGIIGESGSGKTTTARLIMRLVKETSGDILYEGHNLSKISDARMLKLRKNMQMVFQDPYDSLNPRMRIVDILLEPLHAHRKDLPFAEKVELVKKSIEEIELKPAEDFMYRYPHELSGGQLQRIAIARAIILEPKFIVADEPTSMLDVSIRAGILNLLKKLKDKMGLTMMLITHDITTANYLCDRIAVMYQGKIVEMGLTSEVLSNPLHPYTRALVAVVKDLNYFIQNREQFILDGEADTTTTQAGCAFAMRCPYREERCLSKEPTIQINQEVDHLVYCHYPSI